MPFGYTREIFKYPPVQYIPLKLYDNKTGNYPQNLDASRLYIYNAQESQQLQNRLQQLQILEKHDVEKEMLTILVLNGQINLIQYRAYEVIMVGLKKHKQYHLFKITTKYFYKEKLVFIFFNEKNNQRIIQTRYKLQ